MATISVCRSRVGLPDLNLLFEREWQLGRFAIIEA